MAKGFSGIWGVHYSDTLSPVTRCATVRTVMAHGVQHGWCFGTSDISTAFLSSSLEEGLEIWVEFPEGAKHYDESGCELYAKLKKSLYGLNQAPRNFYYHAASIFKDIGFKQSQSDECLFTYDGPEGQVILGLDVDDMFYACSNEKTMEWFRKQLSDRFKITHFDNPDQFVGMDIEWKRNRATLCMERHIQGALKRYDITPDPKITMPMNPDLKTAAYDGVATKEEVSAYRSICGSLLFIAGCARPDICFALSVCTQYLLNPSSAHMDMALRILHYLGPLPSSIP